MSVTKTYTCSSMPGLKLALSGDVVASFFQGKHTTDDKVIQAGIESHKWYGVFIKSEVPRETPEVSSPASSAPGGPISRRRSARGRPPAEEVANLAASSIAAAEKALAAVDAGEDPEEVVKEVMKKAESHDEKFKKSNPTAVIEKTSAEARALPSKTTVARCPLRQLEDIASEWNVPIEEGVSMKEKREMVKDALKEHWK